MTRGEVELEFFQKAGGLDEHIVMMMADEIVRLRKALDEHDTARMTAELLLERERRTSDSHFGMSVMYEKEYERARDILAALREPSEAVVKAAASTYFTTESLQRAVAAAEREVDA